MSVCESCRSFSLKNSPTVSAKNPGFSQSRGRFPGRDGERAGSRDLQSADRVTPKSDQVSRYLAGSPCVQWKKSDQLFTQLRFFTRLRPPTSGTYKTAQEASSWRHSRALCHHRQVDGNVEVLRYLEFATQEYSYPANANTQQEQAMGLWHDLSSSSLSHFKTSVLKRDDKIAAIKLCITIPVAVTPS